MTQRSSGLGFGRFVAGFIGIVAMAALVTGAVAASTAHAVVPADPTATALATDTATPSAVVVTESPSSGATAGPSLLAGSSPTEEIKPGASCNPSLDNQEDAAERLAGKQSEDQNENGDEDGDHAPSASGSPVVAPIASATPEPSEPPHCLKIDPDSHGDRMSGRTAEPSASIIGRDGPGHSWGGDEGGSGAFSSLPPINTFGR